MKKNCILDTITDDVLKKCHPFVCGDPDLNDFLLNDAKLFFEKRIANTYVFEDNGQVIAYFSLLNDKVSKFDTTGSSWKLLKKLFPRSKHFSSYPAIKIGRFAVNIQYKGQGLGRFLMKKMCDVPNKVEFYISSHLIHS